MSATLARSLRHQPKTQEVCVRLTGMAHDLGPDSKLPTVLELRDKMGVSLGTLNSALKVLEASNIIYRIQGIGVFVSPSLQRQVSLVCTPDFFHQTGASPFWQLMVEKARQRAKAKNEAFSCHFSVPDGYKGTPVHAGLARDIEARELHGVLGIGLDKETADWIESHGVPFVAFAGPAPWMVGLDLDELIRLGVDELADQGCKRISYWNPGLATESLSRIAKEFEKNVLWRECLTAHGLEIDEALLQNRGVEIVIGQSHQEQGFRLADEMFSRPRSSWPDGLLFADDIMARGALLAMEKLGVRLGQDVRIVTHANRGSDVLMGRENVLTRIEYDPSEVVRAMFDTLETVMDGHEPSQLVWRVRPTVRRSL